MATTRARLLLVACYAPFAVFAAPTYDYIAQTERPARTQGTVVAGKMTWKCQGSRCTISGPWSRPSVSACRALAQLVGEIKSYGYAGKQLTPKEIERCNAGLVAKAPKSPQRETRASSKSAPAAAPAPSAAKGEIRTAALVFSGTGKPVLGERRAVDVRVSTPALSFAGTGSMPTRTEIAPMRIDTAPLTFTGSGRL